jgi:hypothetical protein
MTSDLADYFALVLGSEGIPLVLLVNPKSNSTGDKSSSSTENSEDLKHDVFLCL